MTLISWFGVYDHIKAKLFSWIFIIIIIIIIINIIIIKTTHTLPHMHIHTSSQQRILLREINKQFDWHDWLTHNKPQTQEWVCSECRCVRRAEIEEEPDDSKRRPLALPMFRQ